MHSKYLIITGILLAQLDAQAAELGACQTSLDPMSADPLSVDTVLPGSPTSTDDTIEFQVGRLEAQYGTDPSARMTGGVLLRKGEKLAGADEARYIPENRSLFLEGNVRYQEQGTRIKSDLAEFAYDDGSVRFEGAEFSLEEGNSRGGADAIEINQQGQLLLNGVSYTTCPPGSNDWLIEAKDIDLDTRKGVGTAKGMKLRFQGIPILYAPYLSFPIGDARKSGVLAPEIGSTRSGGTEIRVPYYFNLAPNYDATIAPHWISDRGFQFETQFRYLTESMAGEIFADYLDNDNIFGDSRYFVGMTQRTRFGGGWRNQIDFSEVSDNQYFEDLGGSLSASSIAFLDRSLSFDLSTEHLVFFGQIQDFQTILEVCPDLDSDGLCDDPSLEDSAIVPSDEPYRRIPQLLASGRWPDQLFGLDLGFVGEIVNFERDTGVTGWRMNLAPEVALPITGPSWFVKPGLKLDYTRYDLDDTMPGQPNTPSRTLPIASFDVGLTLERPLKNNGRVQTLEPRLLYAYVPFREQSNLPVFDTIIPDFNLVQLFRANRYLGVDRIADTDQVSIGVTSRVLDDSTGRELVAATIGQTRYFSDNIVTLPGQTFVVTESSDYIAEIRFLLNKNINFDLGYQWGSSGDGTTRSEARVQYRPARNKVLNLAYRFRRDSQEQGDLSWTWPMGSNWNFVGRYVFSFRDDEALEQFFGLEYESCCWGLRLVSQRYLSTRDGTQDSSIGLQLVLKGMGSGRSTADKVLERGILGYSADIR